MSIEKLISDKAIEYLQANAYVLANNITVSRLGHTAITGHDPVILVGEISKKRLGGPLWQIGLAMKANVNNSKDPDKTILDALYDVIESAKANFINTKTLLDTEDSDYTIDGVIDIDLEIPAISVDESYSSKHVTMNIFVSYDDTPA